MTYTESEKIITKGLCTHTQDLLDYFFQSHSGPPIAKSCFYTFSNELWALKGIWVRVKIAQVISCQLDQMR